MSAARIEVRLRELAQLFNSLDPSPFIDRDLDADAEEFIVSWARELPHHGELELVIHVAVPPDPERAAGVEEAVRHYFANRAAIKERELRQLFRRGRASLLIGVLFLAVCFTLGLVLKRALPPGWEDFADLGLQIVGWVAMWRPLEIYLYDWWPIRADLRLLERLTRMRVRVLPAGG
jgi:hypothetical protein